MFKNFVAVALFASVFLAILTDISEAQDGNIIEIDKKARFILKVIRSKKPTVVFFYSKSSCNACNWSLIPMLEKMVKRRGDSILLAKVDFDELDISQEQGISTIPTTRLYFQGQIVDESEGSSWGGIVKLVNKGAKLQ